MMTKMTRMMTKMTTNKNFEHLLLLYEKMQNMDEFISKMVEENNIEEINEIIRLKTSLILTQIFNKCNSIEQILMLEKTTKMSDEERQKQLEIRKKIEQLEKQNIETLQQKREFLKKELQTTKKSKNLTGAYLSQKPEITSTIDIRE